MVVNPLKRWKRVLGLSVLGAAGLAAVAAAQTGPADRLAECEERFAAAPSERESSLCLRELAVKNPELQDEAVARLDRLRIDYPGEPWVPFDLAGLAWNAGGDRAAELYDEAARRFADRRDAQGELKARGGRAGFLSKEGRLAEAQQEVDRMARLAERLGGVEGAMRVRIQKAGLLRLRGRLEEAAGLLEQDRERVLGAQAASLDPRLRGEWLHGNALIRGGLGSSSTARELLLLALEVVPEEDSAFHCAVWNQLANFDLSSQPLSSETRRRGEEELERAQALAAAGGHRQEEANALWWLGKLRPGEEGVRHLRRCVGIAPTRATAALCLSALASARVNEDPAEARRLIDRALAKASKTEESLSEIYVRREKMRVDWLTRPRAEAIREALETVALTEKILVQPTENELARAQIRSDWFDLGYWLVGQILESRKSREDLKTAFAVLERMRARTLRESLAAAHIGDESSDSPVRLVEIESAVGEDEALVIFQVGLWENVAREREGGGWALVVTRSGTRVYELPASDAAERDIQRLHGLGDLEAMGPTMLLRLHRQLLAPVLAELSAGIGRLTIIPDGALYALPFGALRADETVGSSLAARFELSLAPSATLWADWRRRGEPAPATTPVLVLADPDLRGLPGDAPGPSVARGEALAPLPYARREGKAVKRRLGGRLLVGAQASERALKSEPALSDHAVLHLAAHAVADTEHPERSTVYLTPGEGEDGRLTPAEIVGLDLRDRLVVLAGCETASGELLRGEGALSLARYFFQAGARTVVASLESLPDEPAADLFDRFYRHLAAGASVAEALSRAQRAQLAAGGLARVWAGVQVYGDGELVPFPGGLPEPGLPVGWKLAAVLGLIGILTAVGIAVRRRALSARER